ncbi:MAG: MgtC/SapB family protein, partial [Saprospiraceae bacterium]
YNKLAGVRTNSLVSIGSALFVLAALQVSDNSVDSVRVIAQIASGIGFLGAGVIFKEGLSVSGINTAATIWCTGAIGALCGSGLIAEAAVGSGVVVVVHLLGRPLSKIFLKWIGSKYEYLEIQYEVHIICDSDVEMSIQTKLLQMIEVNKAYMITQFNINDSPSDDKTELHLTFHSPKSNNEDVKKIAAKMQAETGVQQVRWELSTLVH